jgi:myo-inositol-1(or 4)-monophosphatase
MSDATMLPQVAQAAQDAAALLDRQPSSEPYTTWPEFKHRFETVDGLVCGLLRDRLEALRPGVAWAEELDLRLSETGELWVVDAVDGAVQYLQDLPQWSVSIALIRDGQPVLVVLHSSTFGHTYTAARGAGAFRDGRSIAPSRKTELDISLVATSHPPFVGKQPEAVAATGRATAALLPEIGALRNLGPTSWQIAEVASGRIDAFWQYGRDASNLLAGALVATEAGALVTDAGGSPWRAGSESFVAAPPALHAKLIKLLTASAG